MVAKSMSNTRPIVDQQERTKALDPARSFIVRAPAGSGKTELLIQRILKLLCVVEYPEEIVAITFTRKAAAEMRERVLTALEYPEKSKVPEFARAVRDRDVAMQWSLMSNPARLRIQTIDSFSLELASRMPWMSRMGAPLQVTEDPMELFTEAARRTVFLLEKNNELGNAVQSLLHNRDNNIGNVEAMLVQMLSKRDQWLRLTGTGDYSTEQKLELRKRMEAALQSMISSVLKTAHDIFANDLTPELISLADYAGRALADTDSHIRNCAGMREIPGFDAQNLDQWKGIHELLLTQKGEWRKRLTKNEGFPQKDPRKEQMESLLERFTELPGNSFHDALVDVMELPSPHYSDNQWQLILELLLVLPTAAAQLRALFAERGTMDFIESSQSALQSLQDENGDPTDLGMAYGHRIRHLLVDEFQDTSHTQIELLRRLTATWQPEEQRTLFLVGDPMQSIYRFRKADVGMFLKVQSKGIGEILLKPITLHQNFRSQQGIVDWVNSSFKPILSNTNDPERGAVAFEPCVASKGSIPDMDPAAFHPFYSVDSSEYRKREADMIVDLVQQAQAADHKDIAILVRARTHLAEILPAMRRAGIAYQAVEVDSLDQRQPVLDLLALTRALLRPADRIAWLSILRAPWCGIEIADLHALCGEHDDHCKTILHLMQQNSSVLSADARPRVERVYSVMSAALAQRQRLPLHIWVESVWRQLGGDLTLSRVPESCDEEDTRTFFRLLESLDATGNIDIADSLTARLKKLRAAPENGKDAVRIMTIHKAKGLEFDVVIVPGLGSRGQNDDTPLLRWMEHSSLDGSAVFASIEDAGQGKDPHSKFLAWMEKQRSRNEMKRLLYVATTRAKSQLHLLANIKLKTDKDGSIHPEPASGSLLEHLWPAVKDGITVPTTPLPAPAETKQFVVKKLRRLPADFAPSLIPADVDFKLSRSEDDGPREKPTFDWAQETAKIIGTVVHAFLCRISKDGADQWNTARVNTSENAIRAALQSNGLFGDELNSAVVRAKNALAKSLTSKDGKWILTPHPDAASELELTAFLDGETVHKKIDRTFTENGERWIIDYKIGYQDDRSENGLRTFREREKEKYKVQLSEYARIMRLKDDRPIRAALYYPLMDEFLPVDLE